MYPNARLIETFYNCFARKDWQGMIACYHDEVFFYDPVFQNLQAAEAKAMWEMLCRNAKDLVLTYDHIHTDDEYGGCDWTATYTFSRTGRKVTNQIKARFKFQDGKIIEHMDDFDLWKWSRMALGLPGVLLGWSPIIQNKVRKSARKSLVSFMEKKTI
jgi:ketosteroid isomerase-like protein